MRSTSLDIRLLRRPACVASSTEPDASLIADTLRPKETSMAAPTVSRPTTVAASRKRLAAALFLAMGLAALFGQRHGHAQAGDALPYSSGFLVTGDYVVGGVDFTGLANPAVLGFSTGTINISGV
ncbi:MAG TPA: hypothetical protein VKE96_06305, partial [Vicinamibacterales bacterium]|nr:hypothetical protein [Vicinamibacterales bacterium]